MGIKSIILILHCIQICLTYPINDNQGHSNEAGFSPKCANHFSIINSHSRVIENFNQGSMKIPNLGHHDHQILSELELNPNQAFPNDQNIAGPTTNTDFGGHRPFVIPNTAVPVTDDLDTFDPSGQPSGPSQPYPTSKPHPPLRPYPYPPRPVPNGLPNPSDVEVFLPESGHVETEGVHILPENPEKDVQFVVEAEKNKDVGIIEKENPIIVTREQERMIPIIVENEPDRTSSLVVERADRPVLIKKQPRITLNREQAQIMPVIVENEPSRVSPMVIGRADQPVIMEKQNSPIVIESFDQPMVIEEQNSPMVIERDDQRMIIEKQDPPAVIEPVVQPMIIEKRNPITLIREQPQTMPVLVENDSSSMSSVIFERADRPVMYEIERSKITPYIENQQSWIVTRERSNDATPTINENSLDPIEVSQMRTHLTENEQNRDSEGEIPKEFVSIPQELPERMKREENLVKSTIKDTDSSLTSLEENLIDGPARQSIIDNEIMKHESNIPAASSQSLIGVDNISRASTVDDHNEYRQPSQSPNDNKDKKTIASTSILNEKIEKGNANSLPVDEVIHHKEDNGVTQSTIHPEGISTTPIPIDPSQQVTTDDSIADLIKALDIILKNLTTTNQQINKSTTDIPSSINSSGSSSNQPDNKQLSNPDPTPIHLQDIKQPSIHTDATEKLPAMYAQTNVYQHVLDPAINKHPLPSSPVSSYIPYYHFAETQNYMNNGDRPSFGSLNKYDFDMPPELQAYFQGIQGLLGLQTLIGPQALGQLYPFGLVNNQDSKTISNPSANKLTI